MPRKLIRGARVLTFDEGREFLIADILIENDLIAAIAPRIEFDDAETIDAAGMLAMPGLINAHFHSPANFQRGTLEGMPLELFMLYEVPPLARTPPGHRHCYVRTMLGAMEMLKAGITSVMDDAFHVPVPTQESIDGIMQAYADSGMRATVSLDQPNVVEYAKYPFLKDILPAETRAEMDAAVIPTAAELLGLYDYMLHKWHGACGGRLGLAMSCSAPQRVTVPYFRSLSERSRAHDLPFIVHILETKLQRVFGEVVLGKSLVQYVHDLGLLEERMQVVHAIWVDDQDMQLMADAGVTVAHNPVCNLKLGSGIMPFRRLRNQGVEICLGTDELIADDSANLWHAAKTAGLIHKITASDYKTWPTASEILSCLFRGGARAMRRNTGILKKGAPADIILVDLATPAFTPLNDLHRQLVYAENGSSVRMTMVAGNIVMRNGVLTTVDENALHREAKQIIEDSQDLNAEARNATARIEPYYRAMVERAAAYDVGMDRWAHGQG